MKQHKTKRKRLLVLAVCLLTALSMLPVTAMAENPEPMDPELTIKKVEIVDTIEENGLFTLKVMDTENQAVTAAKLKDAGYTITWKRDGKEVKRVKVTGDEYNMAEDMSWVNVAYDKGAQATYTVTVSKGETDSKSASKKVDWYDELQNGSFEVPALNYDKNNPNPRGTWFYIVQTSQNNVPYWKTTALMNSSWNIELGNVKKWDKFRYKNPDYSWWKPWKPEYIYRDEQVTGNLYRCSNAVDGDQIAELNCDGTGALYQDVMTVPGETMNWNLSHRGRNGKDKMALVIAPLTGLNGAESVTTQEALEQYIENNKYNPNVLIEYMEDGQEWKTYTGTFNIPASQFLTRFFFVAISTSTGDLSEGNLLDYVWFSTEAVPLATGKGQLQIVKNIVGLNEEQAQTLIKKELITYKIGENGPEQSAIFESLTSNQNGFTATFTTEITVPENEEVAVTVMENEKAAAVDNYNLTVDKPEKETVTIEGNETAFFNFTNTYVSTELQPIKVSIPAKKMLNGDLTTGSDFTFVLKDKDNKVVQRVNNQGSDITFAPLVFEKAGTYVYTVSEQARNDAAIQYDASVYTIKIQITKDANGYSPEISCTKDGENYTEDYLVFENYTKPQFDTGTLIVKKTVSGGGADRDKAFTFTVKLKMSRPEAKVVAPMSDMLNNGDPSGDGPDNPLTFYSDDVKFEYNGDAFVGTFTLKHNESKTLPIRTSDNPWTYTVTESDNAGYTVTVNNTIETRATGTIEKGKTATVTFKNHKDGGYTPGPIGYPLTIQKVVTGLESVPAGYKATVNVMSKYSSVPTRTLMLEPNKPQTVHLPYGEYTLTETAPAVDGYKLTGQTFSETTFMLTYGGKNVTITNTYTKEQEEPVVIPEDPMAPEDDKPDKPSKPKDDTSKVPKTGDDTPLSLALYGLIAAGALLGIRKAAKRKVK